MTLLQTVAKTVQPLLQTVVKTVRRFRGQKLVWNIYELYRADKLAKVGMFLFSVFLLMAIFGPMLAPYEPLTITRDASGSVSRLSGPTAGHWFGTTNYGRDIFSQWLYGARISLIVGSVAALFATTLGTVIGLTAAYYGGWVDDVLMRFTDLVYGLPGLPFVIALVFILGSSLTNIILVIALIQWRITARVIRSEALSIKERPYIESAESIGASDARIIFLHIFPNVLPLVILYMALTTAWSILMEASISFLGFAAPNQLSWGRMMYQVYNAGVIRDAWWWVLPPGLSIMLLVMSVFFIGRALEKVTNPDLRH
jgi:peptide/nickel transport system permease protein